MLSKHIAKAESLNWPGAIKSKMDKLLALVVCIASSLLLNVNATNCVVEQNLRLVSYPKNHIIDEIMICDLASTPN